MKQRFFKQTFIVTVLCEGGTVSCTDAEDLERLQRYDDVVINLEETTNISECEVTPAEMAQLLRNYDPEYFGLKDDGTLL